MKDGPSVGDELAGWHSVTDRFRCAFTQGVDFGLINSLALEFAGQSKEHRHTLQMKSVRRESCELEA